MSPEEVFKKYTTYEMTRHGEREDHKIECTKGLFSVYARTKEDAEKEAKHYFYQYFSDGEYNDNFDIDALKLACKKGAKQGV